MCYYAHSTFEGNVAADGAAMNLILYGAKFHNVTFKNNRESAVRVSSLTLFYSVAFDVCKFNVQRQIQKGGQNIEVDL